MTDSHSAKATAACLVSVYGAEPICVSSPAADAVEQKYPSPRASQPGRRCLAAQRWALTLTSNVCCHASSVVDSRSRAAADAGVGEEQVDRTEGLLGVLDEVDVAGLGRDVGDHLDGAGQRVGDGGHAVEVGDDHACAAGVEAAGEGGADAARGSGDDDVAVVEVHDGDGTVSRTAA